MSSPWQSNLFDDEPEPPDVDTSVAHIARVYDYWLGGKDHFTADRKAGDKVLEVLPNSGGYARSNRAFLARAIRYLAGQEGIRQFLDIGTGLPSANNTHEVAQAVAPESRVVYADNDPIVLAHARALLSSGPQGATAYLDADVRNTEEILTKAAGVLDFSQPVAVMLIALMHMIPDDDDPYGIVTRLMAAMPAGSFLVLSHVAADMESDMVEEGARRLNELIAEQLTPRTRAQVTQFFDGLAIAEPGVVSVQRWRSTQAEAQAPAIMWGAVAKKP